MTRYPLAGGLVPHLIIAGQAAENAISFYERAFNAKELFRVPFNDGKRLLHATLQINGASLMLQDDFPEFRSTTGPFAPQGVILHLEVEDADRWWQQARQAGATVQMEIGDQFWGARYGQLIDPFGHHWSIGSPLP